VPVLSSYPKSGFADDGFSKSAMRTGCTVVGFVFALLFPLWARADVITLHPSADTSVFQAFPDNSFGTNTDMPTGTTRAGAIGRALIKFDFSQIPQNAVISGASLQLQVVKAPAFNVSSTFGLHRMLKDWNEGIGGSQLGMAASTNDTTWNTRFYPDTPWGSPGGASQVDFAAATNGETFVMAEGTYTIQSTPAMVADVQFWLTNTSANFGWILMTELEATNYTARRFASREDPVNAPTLTVTYTASGSQAQQPTISEVKQMNNQIQFAFNAEANRTYAVEFRSAFDSSNWLTLTNIPAQANPAMIPVSDTISSGTRFYRIRTP
jgi:hypothetical protein